MLAAAARFVDGLAPGDLVALLTSAVGGGTFDFAEARAAIKERMRRAVGTYRAPLGPWNVGRDEAVDANLHPGGTFTVVDRMGTPSTFPLALKPIIERECFGQPDYCPGPVQAQAREIARDARERADAALANLGTLIDWLVRLEGPKHVVLVTGGPVLTPDNYASIASLGARAARARVTVHALQVRDPGYQARADQMRAAPAEIDQSQSAAFALAGTTGGLALTPVTGEIGFARLGRELSAGYVLAFETDATDRDGDGAQDRRAGARPRVRHEPARAPDVPRRPRGAGPRAAVPRHQAQPAARACRPRHRCSAADPCRRASPPPAAPAPAASASKSTAAELEVERVVQKMSAYVVGYGAEASVIVGAEKYTQRVTIEERPVRPRMLVSEFAIVKAAGRVGWSGFRDVVEVDGKPVSDRRDRLLGLLTGPAGGEAELRRIADESARYNVGPVIRNFNVPTTALFFFHPELVGRFTFRRAGTKKIDGVETVVLEFKESRRPTLVMKSDGTDVPCEGTVWVVPADGTIVRTRLRLRNFANTTFMSGGDKWPMDGKAQDEFVSPPPSYQAPAAQAPVQTPPPAQAPPPQGSQPPASTPPASGQTGSGGGTTVTSTTGGESAPRRPRPGSSMDLSPRIVELDSLVDIDVTYRPETSSGIWMPAKMTEVYEGPIPRGTQAPARGRTVGEASYSNFKRFETSVRRSSCPGEGRLPRRAARWYHAAHHGFAHRLDRDRRVPPIVPEDRRRSGRNRPARGRARCAAGRGPRAAGRRRRAADRLRGHVQLAAARRAADAGGSAARQRPRHPHLPGRSRDRRADAARAFEMGTSPSCLALNAAGTRLYSANETDRVGEEKDGTVSAFAIDRRRRAAHRAQHGALRRGRPDLREPAPVGEVPARRQLLRRLGRGAADPRRRPARRGHRREGGRRQDRPAQGDQRAAGQLRLQRPRPHPRAHDPGRPVRPLRPARRPRARSDLRLEVRRRARHAHARRPPRSRCRPATARGTSPSTRTAAGSTRSRKKARRSCCSTTTPRPGGSPRGRRSRPCRPGYAGSNFCSEILVSADGQFVYAGNRLHDSIGIFAVGADGELTFVGDEWTRGNYPAQLHLRSDRPVPLLLQPARPTTSPCSARTRRRARCSSPASTCRSATRRTSSSSISRRRDDTGRTRCASGRRRSGGGLNLRIYERRLPLTLRRIDHIIYARRCVE